MLTDCAATVDPPTPKFPRRSASATRLACTRGTGRPRAQFEASFGDRASAILHGHHAGDEVLVATAARLASVVVGASSGCAVTHDPNARPDDLLERADGTMYEVKRSRRERTTRAPDSTAARQYR